MRERPPEPATASRDAVARQPAVSPTSGVLALQRAAGNRAVASVLSREGEEAQPTDGGAKGAEGARPTGAARVVLSGIGVIAATSFQLRGQMGDATAELILTSDMGEHSAKLIEALTSGKPVSGTIHLRGLKVTFGGGQISGYTVSGSAGAGGGTEQWSITASSMKWEPVDEKK
jgi:hypothetical protein